MFFFLSVQVGDVQVEVSLRCPWPPGSGDVSEASTGTALLRRKSSTGGDQAAKAGRRLTVLNMEQLGFLADDDDDDNEPQ